MDRDLNKYDLHHITSEHPRMSKQEWEYAYREAWKRYYSYEHCETVMRRAVAPLKAFGNTLFLIDLVQGVLRNRELHPVEGGFMRLKSRPDRRPDLPIEPVWQFYPKYWAELVSKHVGWIAI